MRDLIDGRHTNEVWFCCGILTIIGRDNNKYNKYNKYNNYADRITIHPEYDEPVSLDRILKIYPTVDIVIFESDTYGDIYRYNNHNDGEWEKVGRTVGYV